MDKFLEKRYALLGKTAKKSGEFSTHLRSFLKNPINHFILFLLAAIVVGDLSINKVLPYSFASSFALATSYQSFALLPAKCASFPASEISGCLLMGYSGLASLGTGGFIGIGTYAVYYIMNESGLQFWVAILVALLVAALIGVIVGFISLRIEGIYLVILTLGLSEILRNLYMVVEDRIKVGNFEIFNGIEIKRQHAIFIVSVALVIIMIITHNIINSPTGRAMLAMKNSTAAAQAMGISLLKYRLMAFVICTMYAALSGVMLMITVRSAMASDGTGF